VAWEEVYAGKRRLEILHQEGWGYLNWFRHNNFTLISSPLQTDMGSDTSSCMDATYRRRGRLGRGCRDNFTLSLSTTQWGVSNILQFFGCTFKIKTLSQVQQKWKQTATTNPRKSRKTARNDVLTERKYTLDMRCQFG
jgi:hypothetical protein